MNLAKQEDIKSIFRNQRYFCTPTMKFQKEKLGKNPICYISKKNKVPRDKPNQESKKPILRKLYNTKEKN